MAVKYRGDLFGTRGNYDAGMIYLSRMAKRSEDNGALSPSYEGMKPTIKTEDLDVRLYPSLSIYISKYILNEFGPRFPYSK